MALGIFIILNSGRRRKTVPFGLAVVDTVGLVALRVSKDHKTKKMVPGVERGLSSGGPMISINLSPCSIWPWTLE